MNAVVISVDSTAAAHSYRCTNPRAAANWAFVRGQYNDGKLTPGHVPSTKAPYCGGSGTQQAPFTFPNAKRPPAGLRSPEAIFSFYHPRYLREMTPETLESIRRTATIHNRPCKSAGGHAYILDSSKQQQRAYDEFFVRLFAKFESADRYFQGRPKPLNPETMRVILSRPKEDFIFGKRGDSEPIFVLPRKEVICIADEYFEARHTHRELATERGELVAAGTIEGGRYNLRSGHFCCQELPATERAEMIRSVDRCFFEALHPGEPYTGRDLGERRLPYDAIGISGVEGMSR